MEHPYGPIERTETAARLALLSVRASYLSNLILNANIPVLRYFGDAVSRDAYNQLNLLNNHIAALE